MAQVLRESGMIIVWSTATSWKGGYRVTGLVGRASQHPSLLIELERRASHQDLICADQYRGAVGWCANGGFWVRILDNYRARWRSGNTVDSYSGGPGFDSRSGHPAFGFPWFPEITPDECWDRSQTRPWPIYSQSFPQSLFPAQLAPSLMTSLTLPSCQGDYVAARPRARGEEAIRATVTRTPSVLSLLRARRAVFLSWRCTVQIRSNSGAYMLARPVGALCPPTLFFTKNRRNGGRIERLRVGIAGSAGLDSVRAQAGLVKTGRVNTGGETQPATQLFADWNNQIMRGAANGRSFEARLAPGRHTWQAPSLNPPAPPAVLAFHQGESGSIPGQFTPDFRKWESFRTMPLVVGFSRESLVSPHPFIPALIHTHATSPSSALKISMLKKTVQISSLIRIKLQFDCFTCLRREWQELASKQGEPGSIQSGVTPWIFACGNRARRCRWLASFLGDISVRSPLHSGAAPYSPRFTFTGFLDPVVKRRPNLCTPLHSYRHEGNTARLARRSDEALEVRVSVALIAPQLLDLGR
ncbi:hypothetical protein PR048_008185 [Dryococelus australis]|uniref:Uncharacterized protein n=1 Tax=Dryococelus australis TaxID=614101 RepID=A0ABQ9HWE0_9NEOP|nr:hypothetical protein PR048_008185 [Dryococelus australis]